MAAVTFAFSSPRASADADDGTGSDWAPAFAGVTGAAGAPFGAALGSATATFAGSGFGSAFGAGAGAGAGGAGSGFAGVTGLTGVVPVFGFCGLKRSFTIASFTCAAALF